MNDYYISCNKSLLKIEKIWFLLKDCFWSKNIPLEYVKKFIQHSICFAVYEEEAHQLVGFGRVITDYTTYAYICDVVIDVEHRGKGLGRALIKEILSCPELQGLKTLALRTTEQARKIYEENGFSIAAQPETQLEINDIDIYCRPTFIYQT